MPEFHGVLQIIPRDSPSLLELYQTGETGDWKVTANSLERCYVFGDGGIKCL